MSRNLLFKAVALMTLLGFFLVSVPALSSAPKRNSKFDLRILVKKPATWISSFMSFLSPVFGQDNPETSRTINSDNSGAKVKPTGDIIIVRPSRGD